MLFNLYAECSISCYKCINSPMYCTECSDSVNSNNNPPFCTCKDGFFLPENSNLCSCTY